MSLCNDIDADEVSVSLSMVSRALVVCALGDEDPGCEIETYLIDPYTPECRVVATIENPMMPSGPFRASILPPCGPAVVYPVDSLSAARRCILQAATAGIYKFSCEGCDCAYCPLFVQH